jgi:hypothetical protein
MCRLVAPALLIATGLCRAHAPAPAEPETRPTWTVLKPAKAVSESGATLTRQTDDSLLAEGKNPKSDTYKIIAHTRLTGITAVRLEVMPDRSLGGGGPGRTPHGNFVLDEFRVTAAPRKEPARAVAVALHRANADYSQWGFPVAAAIDGSRDTGWAVDPLYGRKHVAVFEAKQPFGFAEGTVLTFTLEQGLRHELHTIGRLRLSVTAVKPPFPLEVLELSAKELAAAWADLAGADAARAEGAITNLALCGQAVPFLTSKLKAAPVKADSRKMAALVEALDHARFAERERATAELAKLGPAAAPALAEAVRESPSLEARRRAAQLLAKVGNSPSLLPERRGVEVLVRLGTAGARRLLKDLARGRREAWLTQQARDGLYRLANGGRALDGKSQEELPWP